MLHSPINTLILQFILLAIAEEGSYDMVFLGSLTNFDLWCVRECVRVSLTCFPILRNRPEALREQRLTFKFRPKTQTD